MPSCRPDSERDIGNADGGGAIVTIRLPISGQEL